jgi:prepilin-type N-terminal cleavage/methylation domain-containing protein
MNKSISSTRGLPAQTGFTLIELLVVIAIIGILSSVVLASLNSARQKGRDARRLSDVKQLQLALELYYDSNGQYPTTLSTSSLITPGYIAAIPRDPSSNAVYTYVALDTNSNADTCESYHIGATLEGTDSAALDGDNDASAATGCTGGGTDFDGTDPIFDVKP